MAFLDAMPSTELANAVDSLPSVSGGATRTEKALMHLQERLEDDTRAPTLLLPAEYRKSSVIS